MKKKFLSWLLVFSMILTLFPQAVQAADSPFLGFRWPDWEDGPIENPESELDTLTLVLQPLIIPSVTKLTVLTFALSYRKSDFIQATLQAKKHLFTNLP